MISAGRRINNDMSKFVAQEIVKVLLKAGVNAPRARIFLLGMTFKENCPDTRNSRAVDVYRHLTEYGLTAMAADPLADPYDFLQEYSIELVPEEEVREADCIVILAAHDCYRRRSLQELRKLYKKDCKAPVLIDVRNIYSRKEAEKLGFVYWSL